MREPEAFWDPDGDGSPNPPLSTVLIDAAERILGVKLPPSYLQLLRVQNGGYTRRFVLPTSVSTSWAEDHVPVDDLFGIGSPDDEAGHQSILCTAYMTRDWGLPPKQVVLCGDGHWWISLDYRRGETPQVSWIDVEVEEDIVLAESFDEFLANLLPDDVVDPDTCRIRSS
jgi:hypothetical protein